MLDLKGAWTSLWSAINTGTFASIMTLLTWAGVILVVFAVLKWLWDKRRGGGGNSQSLIWTSVLGGALAAPNLLLPIVLGLIDMLVNTIASALP
jgi:hypothetical protein